MSTVELKQSKIKLGYQLKVNKFCLSPNSRIPEFRYLALCLIIPYGECSMRTEYRGSPRQGGLQGLHPAHLDAVPGKWPPPGSQHSPTQERFWRCLWPNFRKRITGVTGRVALQCCGPKGRRESRRVSRWGSPHDRLHDNYSLLCKRLNKCTTVAMSAFIDILINYFVVTSKCVHS
jgi:hypothetical protein